MGVLALGLSLPILWIVTDAVVGKDVSPPLGHKNYCQSTQIRSTRYPDGVVEPPSWCIMEVTQEAPGSIGAVTEIETRFLDPLLDIWAGEALVRVEFIHLGIVRIRLAPKGVLKDPTDGEMIELPRVRQPFTFENDGTTFRAASGDVVLSGTLSPLKLTLSKRSAGEDVVLWREAEPMAWNKSATWQTLEPLTEAKIYGCGMQNGYFDHTGRTVNISEGGGWDAGGRANPAPFFMSSRGFGIFRNTFSPGRYIFSEAPVLAHHDFGLDSFHFVGGDLKAVLGLYTSVTGKPFLPPLWGLWMGDSDCYNNKKHNFTTAKALDVARNYQKHNIPRGWMLVNDGYGCGYTSREELESTEAGLTSLGLRMGLWTSTGLGNATWEIGVAGSRVIKTDVAWVGDGYRFGLNAVKLAAHLMTNSSDSRPYTWTVCGWAGTQKYAVVWTGDNSGSWEYIRMQIPTVIGSGLSALAHASGDVDGIFGGSPETYVRDLQWKTFLTVTMSMSGWAKTDKQPWTYGEPYTSHNRKALELRAQLTPYLYSLSFEAHQYGVPPVRAMALEFPEESWEGADPEYLNYQFMSGPSFLVAPIFKPGTVREGIILPSGEWIDYNTGRHFEGPKVLGNYEAALDVLPVFVRAGAIVPMWPLMEYVGQRESIDFLILDAYPRSTSNSAPSSFTIYEDDGYTRKYAKGEVASQTFHLTTLSSGDIEISISPSIGSYDKKPLLRSYLVKVHLDAAPDVVTKVLQGKTIVPIATCEGLNKPTWGWAMDCQKPQHGSILYIRTSEISLDDICILMVEIKETGVEATSESLVV